MHQISFCHGGRRRLLPPCITWQNYANCLGTLNVRRVNGIAKKEEMVDVLIKGKLELLALTEIKLKGNGKV